MKIRGKKFLIPAILVVLVLLVGPLASLNASVRIPPPKQTYAAAPAVAAANGNTVLLTAALTVVAVTAVATTTTDLAVATEFTVFTEVAARTTGELGEPLPYNEPNSGSQASLEQLAHSEFDS
ncbi:MAG: hypothetical protein WAM82_04245 [Thermoanaerobaculia bacterium]